MTAATSAGHPWALPAHRAWLQRGFDRLIAFAQPSVLSSGGFAYQDADGAPMAGRVPQLFLTCRMAHVAAIGVAQGIPGSGRLLDHAVASLLGAHHDAERGGWFTSLDGDTQQRKQAYDHVHVGLAAAGALGVAHPDAPRLLALVREVVDGHFWDEGAGALRESFASDWSDEEAYRGANANMHGVEAFLALGDVTGEPLWHQRALRMADRIINHGARQHDWLVPEHFAADWTPLPDYNRDQPDHPFRPYGATPGHALEWARFLVMLDRSPLIEHPAWLVEAAGPLTRRARASWGCDGRDGLPYTVDWDGKVVSALRLHWPVCEGIQTCVAVSEAEDSNDLDEWYRQLWDFAAAYFIDAQTGAWINELNNDGGPGTTVWPGRPDVYHCAGALQFPLSRISSRSGATRA